MPKIAIVEKPCYIQVDATCRLPYKDLVEAISACLTQNKSNNFLSTRRARTFQWYVFKYLVIHERLNYSLSMWLFLMLRVCDLSDTRTRVDRKTPFYGKCRVLMSQKSSYGTKTLYTKFELDL